MYFFDDIEKQKELETILKSWINTPFRHGCGVKGLGTDCIHFVVKVLEEVKFFNHPFKLPKYDRDWCIHQGKPLLLDGIFKTNRFENMLNKEPINGDLLLFQFGRHCSHIAFFFNNDLYQSFDNYGVRKFSWKDKYWYSRMKFIFRAMT